MFKPTRFPKPGYFPIGLMIGWAMAMTGSANSQENAEQRREQVIALLKREAAEMTATALADIGSLEDWKKARPKRKREYLYMLGLDPLPKRTPLQANITGRLSTPGFTVEKVVFQSMPGLYVTGNFYLPQGPEKPLPTILYVCGHSPHPLGAKFHYQDRAQWLADHGYACLVIDTLEFGEVAGIHHGLHNLNMWRWISVGYTPAGVEVWNAMRAVDYLETRPEVDQTRIGITGISGGGAVSWYAAAADERLAVAVPVCGTFTYGSQAAHWLADGQCDCIYFNNTYHSDLGVVAALIAPRPLLMCSGRRDSIFPPDGYHEVFRQTQRIYDLYARPGKTSNRVKEVDDDVLHSDSPVLRSAARQWLKQWLKDDNTPVAVVPNPKEMLIPAAELACLDKLPPDAANFGIHDHFVPTAKPGRHDELDSWNKRKQDLIAELHDKTFRWFPTADVPFEATRNGGHGGWLDRYGNYTDTQIQTEPESFIRVQTVKARERDDKPLLVIYVKRASDTLSAVDVDELLPLFGRCDVAFLNARLTDTRLGQQEFTNIERSAVWVGRTVAAMQVWDILRTLEWLLEDRSLSPSRVVVFAKNEMAVPAFYATLLDDRIHHLIVRNPPGSHTNAPALLNVLRFTDIPEIAAGTAPRKITFLGRPPEPFEFTKQIYGLHGNAAGISSASSLAAALKLWE